MLQYSIGVFLYVIYTWTLDNVQLSTVQWTYQISINMIIFTPTLAALLDPFPHSTSCSCSSSVASTATQRRHTCVNFSFILDRLYLLREASEIKWPESNLIQFLVDRGSEGPIDNRHFGNECGNLGCGASQHWEQLLVEKSLSWSAFFKHGCNFLPKTSMLSRRVLLIQEIASHLGVYFFQTGVFFF